jgi:hypothetical protein
MKQTDPLKFFSKLRWIDGRTLLDVVEPYRRKIFTAYPLYGCMSVGHRRQPIIDYFSGGSCVRIEITSPFSRWSSFGPTRSLNIYTFLNIYSKTPSMVRIKSSFPDSMTRFTEFRSDFFTASMGRRIPVGSLVTCLRITFSRFLDGQSQRTSTAVEFPAF